MELIAGFPAAARVPEPIVVGFDAPTLAACFGAVDVFAAVGGRLPSTGWKGLATVGFAAELERTAGLPFGGSRGFAVVVDLRGGRLLSTGSKGFGRLVVVDFRAVADGRLLSTGWNGFGRADFVAALDRTAGFPSGGSSGFADLTPSGGWSGFGGCADANVDESTAAPQTAASNESFTPAS
jgi:hypothetical protein